MTVWVRPLWPNFNPRSPWGGATWLPAVSGIFCRFQSTLPVGGSDEK